MCAALSVLVCYTLGETEGNGDVCCSKLYGFYSVGRGIEIVMCASVSVMVFYSVGETEGNGKNSGIIYLVRS